MQTSKCNALSKHHLTQRLKQEADLPRCVQINFEEHIVKLLQIGGKDRVVLYEGINSLCFSCGCVSHKSESCPYYMRTSEKVGGKEGDVRPLEKVRESKSDVANP